MEGGVDEGAGLGGRGGRSAEGVDGGGAVGGGMREQVADECGVGAEVVHGFEVKLEVADGTAFKDVALFAEDDLVDEAAGGGQGRWAPWDGGAGEARLQSLEQRHKVPYREDVRLHKEAQMRRRTNAGVERMPGEAGLKRGDARLKEVE